MAEAPLEVVEEEGDSEEGDSEEINSDRREVNPNMNGRIRTSSKQMVKTVDFSFNPMDSERKDENQYGQSYQSRAVRERQQRLRRLSTLDMNKLEKPVLNQQAVQVIKRVRDKLSGQDFNPEELLDVVDQVDNLIKQATSHENLCVMFSGWCSWW